MEQLLKRPLSTKQSWNKHNHTHTHTHTHTRAHTHVHTRPVGDESCCHLSSRNCFSHSKASRHMDPCLRYIPCSFCLTPWGNTGPGWQSLRSGNPLYPSNCWTQWDLNITQKDSVFRHGRMERSHTSWIIKNWSCLIAVRHSVPRDV